jgi:exonuclease III
MRVVSWNIRAGGGRRGEAIARQLREWQPDVVALSEFRGTPSSQALAGALSQQGLLHQRDTCVADDPARNALLVASRWPLRKERWLRVRVQAPVRFEVFTVHVPNRVTRRKYPFLDAISDVVAAWRGPPAILVGDTNSGRIGIDEESLAFSSREDQWLLHLDALGWRDAFRARYPNRREFTWYSPNGNNGFRLDQAFLHPQLMRRLRKVRHVWGRDGSERRDALSDHAAIIVDVDEL